LWGTNPGPKLKDTLTKPIKPVILLASNPNQYYQAYRQVDLQLSGNNMGGQIFPLHILLYPFQPYFSGEYLTERSTLYVSRGLGYWLVPLRFGASPEITRIKLRSRPRDYAAEKEEL